MTADVLRDLWAEPAPEPPARRGWDTAIIGTLVGAGLLDGLLSTEVAWPTITIPVMMVLPLALRWRHSHTLAVAAVVFGTYSVLHGAMLAAGVTSTFLNAGVIIVSVYTLARWASGRDAIIGLGMATVGTAFAGSTEVLRELSGAVGLPTFIGLFALAGVAIRLWSSRGAARLSEAKMMERNRIARELHDTIAHHVSAIAVQAQGAQEILDGDPETARAALATIEQQASLTLAEMRLILGVLRDHKPDDLFPRAGIEDIARLADSSGGSPQVEVALSGDLEHVSPSVGSAVFRLTQEAITNARRHARNATLVAVDVVGSGDRIQVTVTDDGQPTSGTGPGYGLLGMTERATLMGGECHAGPSDSGGWVVKASLPRTGRST